MHESPFEFITKWMAIIGLIGFASIVMVLIISAFAGWSITIASPLILTLAVVSVLLFSIGFLLYGLGI